MVRIYLTQICLRRGVSVLDQLVTHQGFVVETYPLADLISSTSRRRFLYSSRFTRPTVCVLRRSSAEAACDANVRGVELLELDMVVSPKSISGSSMVSANQKKVILFQLCRYSCKVSLIVQTFQISRACSFANLYIVRLFSGIPEIPLTRLYRSAVLYFQ